MKRAFLIILLLFAVFYFSCRKENEKAFWDTQLLAPLIDASLGINNLLPDSILKANPDSSLKIVYENDIYKLAMDTILKIPDTTVKQFFVIPVPVTFSPDQTVVSNSPSETTYSLQGVQLRSTVIKAGLLHYNVKSLIHQITDIVYSIPCAKLNGNPFSISISVPAATGNMPGIYDQTFDLSGYDIDLTGIYNNKVNTLYTSLTAKISQQGQAVLVNPTDSLIINSTFYKVVPSYAKGYFGQNTFNVGPSQSKFTMFNRIVSGTLKFESVNFNLKIENPIGLDARIYFNNLSSINSRTGTPPINLQNSIIGSETNINRASESGGMVYSTTANFPLNSSNSNIKDLIENLPDKFAYSMKLITNPLGNISGSNDFIYSDKLLKASLNMEIPLSVVANNLTLVDTLALNTAGSTQNINSGTISLFADNGFPFDAGIQIYLLNSSNGIADSLLGSSNTIVEAPVNSSLRVIGKKLTKIMIPLSKAKMTQLYNTKKLMLKVKFNTSSQPSYIKIYSDYTINIRLVGDVNYTIHLQ